ncbi:hypothetical protein Tco_0363590 [Tanacetum coccineum]
MLYSAAYRSLGALHSCIKNKEVEVEELPRNLRLYKNKKHMSSECNNIKLAIQKNLKLLLCAMCKQCLITFNHDVCVLNYVNDMNSRVNNFNANVSNTANEKKHKPKVKKPKTVQGIENKAKTDSPVQLIKGKPFESFISRSQVRNQPWLVLLLNPTATSDATWNHSGDDIRQPDRPLTRGNPT